MALLKPFVKRNRGFSAGMPSSRVASANSENMEMSGVRESDRAVLELLAVEHVELGLTEVRAKLKQWPCVLRRNIRS